MASKRIVSILLSAVLILGSLAFVGCGKKETPEKTGSTDKEPVTIKLSIGSGQPATGVAGIRMLKDFLVPEVKKRVAERTNYRIDFSENYGGTVAKVGDELESIQSGLLDMGFLPFLFEPTKSYVNNFTYYAPFGSGDPIEVAKIVKRIYKEVPEITEMYEKNYNQKLLGFATVESYNLVTNFPVSKVADLKGHKVAAAGPNLPWVGASGATPVQSTGNEAYTSLSTGVYDGWALFSSAVVGFKLHEVAKHYTITNFGSVVPYGFSINLDTWNKLPSEVRDIILEVSNDYIDAAAQDVSKIDKAMVETMEKAGSTVTTLPAGERTKWMEALPNLPHQFATEADKMGMPGTKVIKLYLQYLEEAGYKFPNSWKF